MLIKLKWPISAMVASIIGLVYSSFMWAGIAGIALEISMAVMILTSLISEREFGYESWVGWLLNQYIVLFDVSIVDIITLIFARVFCFMLLIFPAVTGSGWLVFPVLLYLLGTCVHVLRGEQDLPQ